MTAGEMREQKIRLRVELEEAEERLNQLRESICLHRCRLLARCYGLGVAMS
jgi:hypothetical protein